MQRMKLFFSRRWKKISFVRIIFELWLSEERPLDRTQCASVHEEIRNRHL